MFRLTLVTPVKKLTTELPIEEVLVPGFQGELDILPGHAPLVTTLKTGVLRYREQGSTEYKKIAVSWGYLEVFGDHVSVLAETAELPEEIDYERVRATFARAHEKLVVTGELHEDEYNLNKWANKIERAYTRASVAEKTIE